MNLFQKQKIFLFRIFNERAILRIKCKQINIEDLLRDANAIFKNYFKSPVQRESISFDVNLYRDSKRITNYCRLFQLIYNNNYISRTIIRIPCVMPWNSNCDGIIAKTLFGTILLQSLHLHALNFDLYVGTDDSKSDFRASSANFRMQCNLQTSLFSSFKYRYHFLHTNEQFLKSRKSRYENITSSTVSGNRAAIPSVIIKIVKKTTRKTEEPDKISFFLL